MSGKRKHHNLSCLVMAWWLLGAAPAAAIEPLPVVSDPLENFVPGASVYAAPDEGSGGGRFAVPERLPIDDGVCEIKLLPLWTATADVPYLTRSETDGVELVQLLATRESVVTSDQLEFGYETQLRLGLKRRIHNDFQVELNYLHIDDLNANAAFTLPTQPFLHFLRVGLSDAGGNLIRVGDLKFAYGSSFRSGEINLQRSLNELLGIQFGIRVAEFDEQYRAIGREGQDTVDHAIAADNSLVGAQLGGVLRLIEGRRVPIRLDVQGKVGGFFNQARFDNRLNQVVDGVSSMQLSRGEEIYGSFLGEVQAVAAVRISPAVSLRCGYQVLFLGSVLLAPDAIESIDRAADRRFTVPGRDVLYHGGFLGLEVRH